MSEGGTDVFLRAEETDQDSAQALNVNAVVFALARQYLLLCLDKVCRNLIHFYSLHSFPKNIDVRNINAMAATVHIENRKVLRIGNFPEQRHTNAKHTVQVLLVPDRPQDCGIVLVDFLVVVRHAVFVVSTTALKHDMTLCL